MTCEKCGEKMDLRELPYLTAPEGVQVDERGAVKGLVDTGMKITVWFCPEPCAHVVLPPNSKPYWPAPTNFDTTH
jgi:hypothetical protein